MAWVRIDDQIHSHPKIIGAGNEAVGAWLRMLAWSAAHLTDGALPAGVAVMMTGGQPQLVGRLAAAGLLDADGDDYLIHNYHEWNPTADEVRERQDAIREKRRQAGRKGAAARWQNGKRDGKRDGTPDSKTGPGASPADEVENGRPTISDLYSKNGKRDGKRDGKTMAPSPSPSPYEREGAAGDRFTLGDIEPLGFDRFGQLGGKAQASISMLCPVYRHELDAALATDARSWAYVAKVIRSYREEMARAAAPAGSPNAKPRGALARTTQQLAEGWANEPNTDEDPKAAIFGADGALAGLLPRKDRG